MRSVKDTVRAINVHRAGQAGEISSINALIGARNPEAMLRHVNHAIAETNSMQVILVGLGARLEKQVEKRLQRSNFLQVVEAAGKYRISEARKLTARKAAA